MSINIKKLIHILIAALTVANFSAHGQSKEKSFYSAKDNGYSVAAYIWPSCHHDERFGEMMWPEGIGEWEIIKKGNPRFDGHYQPKMPLWGYEMDDDPQVMEKWIDAATDHGVNTFIFDWYWFDNGPFLESTLNEGFLKAKNRDQMQFYIMWANHDVKRDFFNVHKYKGDTTILWDGAVDFKTFKTIVDRVINQYFIQPNYFKIDDKPVFSVFSIINLVEGFGGAIPAREAIDYFRSKTKEAGFPGLHIQMIQDGVPNEDLVKQIEILGINSITEYNWGTPHPTDYIQWGLNAIQKRSLWDKELQVPFFPNVSISWDNTPRFPLKGQEDVIRYNKSPESFAAYLLKAKEYCDNHPEQTKLITIFAWNEWIEGSYLLPDVKYGFGYLKALKEVMSGLYEPYSNNKPIK